ncbi:MAG TPA: putative peptidoglycan glycosyltransferase FtsW [Bacteroidota bacterium]|nr:putative peptidoglycan glycosyltransferase FtsW [Bacteroidota bacterium]
MAKQRNHMDRWTFIVVVVLMGVSTFIVYSASSAWALQNLKSESGLVNKHIVKVFIGLVVMFIGIGVDYHKYKYITKYVLMAAIALLGVTLVSGGETKGAVRWLSLGGFSFQPSEFAKFALLFHLSTLLSTKKEKLNDLKKGFIPLLWWVGIVTLLVLLQPNFSMGGIIFMLGIMMMFIGGARFKHLAISMLGLIPVLIGYMLSAPYRMRRVLSYLGMGDNPEALKKAKYQLWQGIIGFGNGGFFGVGMGQSKQRDLFLPESYGDFIFSIVGEEYGLIGTIVFMAVFFLILLRGLRIARHAPDDLGKFLALSITVSIVTYALGNAMVTLGLVPTTGLPMPFVSYGGSAIIFSAFAVGVLLNISSQTDMNPRLAPIDVSAPETTPVMPPLPGVKSEPSVGKVY